MMLGYQCQYNGFLGLSNTDTLDFGSEQPAQYFIKQVLDINLGRSLKFLKFCRSREGGDSFGWGLFVKIARSYIVLFSNNKRVYSGLCAVTNSLH